MCGIAGIVDPGRDQTQIASALCAMNDTMVHRGPDDSGAITGHGIGIGMRRLSIMDVQGGQQPISNESGDIHVVCNGEIYNFAELRKELEQKGHRFSTGSDAEAIVHLYEEYGTDCIERLYGMFGLAIWDQRQSKLVIARDRLGKKPLFYAHQGGRLLFASEMKALLAVDPQLNKPNYHVLGQYLQFGYIFQPDTIYSEIERLPAGHLAVLDDDGFRQSPYWSVQFAPDEARSASDWQEELDALMQECVKCRLQSEVPLGIFLSGGIDSSAVVAYAHQAGLSPMQTFTIGFDRAEWDESGDAQRVADHFGTTHHTLRIREQDLLNSFEDTLTAIVHGCDEPFGDASALPTFHVSKLAREHVTVILSGDGGDELFAGYSSYQGALFAQRYRSLLPYSIGRHVLPGMARAASNFLPGKYHYQALRAAKVFRDSALPIHDAYRDKTSIWNVDEITSLLHTDLIGSIGYLGEQYLPDPLWSRLKQDGDLVGRLTEVDVQSYLVDDILVKVDRMSMAHSLEVRSPLLDHRMVELAARVPTRLKIQGTQGKVLLKQVLESKLPKGTLRKRKQGFSVPLRDWFRGRLQPLVRDYLGTGGYLPSDWFNQDAVSRVLDEHQAGTADHANKIWLLLTFATWHRNYQQTVPSNSSVPNKTACEVT